MDTPLRLRRRDVTIYIGTLRKVKSDQKGESCCLCAAVVMCLYMCRWRRTLDFDFWDLGRVSHLEEENNGSQLAGACKASRSYLRV